MYHLCSKCLFVQMGDLWLRLLVQEHLMGNVSKLAKSSKITLKMAFIPHLTPSSCAIEVIIVLKALTVFGEIKESSIRFPYLFNIKWLFEVIPYNAVQIICRVERVFWRLDCYLDKTRKKITTKLFYYTLYSLSVFSLAKSLQLILEISRTGCRLVNYPIYSINRRRRLLNFWTSRVALIRGWALIKFSPFSASGVCLFCKQNNKC